MGKGSDLGFRSINYLLKEVDFGELTSNPDAPNSEEYIMGYWHIGYPIYDCLFLGKKDEMLKEIKKTFTIFRAKKMKKNFLTLWDKVWS